MKKIVINKKYGGFGISKEAGEWILLNDINGEVPQKIKDQISEELSNEYFYGHMFDEHRKNPVLVKCVETLGEKSYGSCAKLVIVEIEDNEKYFIDEYDGYESVKTSDGIEWED